MDRQKQYFRRNCLFIHGVKENEKENTDVDIIEIFERKM